MSEPGESIPSSENDKIQGTELQDKESMERKKNLEEALNTLNPKDPGRLPAFNNTIFFLANAGEKDLVMDGFNLYLFDVIEEVTDNSKDMGMVDRFQHASRVYVSYIMKDLPGAEKIHELGRELGNLYALKFELGGDYQRAAKLYKKIGNAEKAEENSIKEDLDFDKDDVISPINLPEGRAMWEKAVQDFIDKGKDNNPFDSKEERDAALEKLKTDIQNKVNTIN